MGSEMSAMYLEALKRRSAETYSAFTTAMQQLDKTISPEQRSAIIRHVAVLHQCLSRKGFALPQPEAGDA